MAIQEKRPLSYYHDGGVVRDGFGRSGFQIRHSKGGPIVENLSQTLQHIVFFVELSRQMYEFYKKVPQCLVLRQLELEQGEGLFRSALVEFVVSKHFSLICNL